MWNGVADVALTAPSGPGWTAQLAVSALKPDGRERTWTEDVLLSAETALHTLAAPADDDGVVTKLVVRVFYVNADGGSLAGPMLRSRFVVAEQGRYLQTEERFDSVIIDGVLADPHDGMALDEEVAR